MNEGRCSMDQDGWYMNEGGLYTNEGRYTNEGAC